MTIIAGFSYATFSVLVADSRLTGVCGDGTVMRRDVCQKMFPLGDKGLVCWSGGLGAARYLMSKIDERSRQDGPWWLLDPDDARGTLETDYKPSDFSEAKVSLIAQLINPTRRAFDNEDWPRVDMIKIDIPPFQHEVVPYGTRVCGSGDYIVPRIEEDNLFTGVATFSGASPDFERAVINKALLAQEIVERLIREKYEPTVGGLYQIGYLLPDRVRVLSYERWVSANRDETYGTYVTLKVEDGHWWQEHKQTTKHVKLLNPFAYPVENEFTRDLLFDASLFTPTTPGVVATPNPLRVSHFISAHGAAENLVFDFPEPPSDPPLGPEGTFRRIGPNPSNVGARR